MPAKRKRRGRCRAVPISRRFAGFTGGLVDAVDVDFARRRRLLLDRARDRRVDLADLGDDLADFADRVRGGLARCFQ